MSSQTRITASTPSSETDERHSITPCTIRMPLSPRSVSSEAYQDPSPAQPPTCLHIIPTRRELTNSDPAHGPAVHNRRISSDSAVPSSRLSISKQSSPFLQYPEYPTGLAPPTNVPPLKKSRSGLGWKTEASGLFFEIKLGRKNRSDESLDHESSSLPIGSQAEQSSSHQSSSDRELTPDSIAGSSIPLLQMRKSDSISIDSKNGEYREGLYCRTKRRLGLKRGPVIRPALPEERRNMSITGILLDRTSSILRVRELSEKRQGPRTAFSSTSDLSIAGVTHSRPGLFQRSSNFSASSSIRNIFMGESPVPTPDPEAFYTGSDDQRYFRVDIGNSNSPTFLPSEAKRINTPPMAKSESGKIRPHEYFFDHTPPSDEKSESPTPESFSLRPSRPHLSESTDSILRTESSGWSLSGSTDSTLGSERDWFRVIVPGLDEGVAKPIVHDVPEHLPKSPLCPKNRRGRGKGNCVYHGQLSESQKSVDKMEKLPDPLRSG